MAVLSVKERFQSRRSGYAPDGTITHLREWLVKCDDKADGTALAMSVVPGPGTTHPTDGRCKVTKQDADVHESSDRHFLVKDEYTGSGNSILMPADPLARPPTFQIGANEANENYFIDNSPTPKYVTSSSGDPFENPLTRFTGETQLQVGLNEAAFGVITLENFKYTTNADIVYVDGQGYAPDTLLLTIMTATKHQETLDTDGTLTPVKYYAVIWNLKVSAGGWKDKCLDLGTNELWLPVGDPPVPPTAEIRPIYDKSQGKVQKPWPLDGHGKKMPLPTDTPATLTFVPYRSVPWTAQFRVFRADIWQ